jgi:hypothetical protein
VPNINVEITDELLKAIRIRCAEEGMTQKDWVPMFLAEALGMGSVEVSAAGGGDAIGPGRVSSVPNSQESTTKK